MKQLRKLIYRKLITLQKHRHYTKNHTLYEEELRFLSCDNEIESHYKDSTRDYQSIADNHQQINREVDIAQKRSIKFVYATHPKKLQNVTSRINRMRNRLKENK